MHQVQLWHSIFCLRRRTRNSKDTHGCFSISITGNKAKNLFLPELPMFWAPAANPLPCKMKQKIHHKKDIKTNHIKPVFIIWQGAFMNPKSQSWHDGADEAGDHETDSSHTRWISVFSCITNSQVRTISGAWRFPTWSECLRRSPTLFQDPGLLMSPVHGPYPPLSQWPSRAAPGAVSPCQPPAWVSPPRCRSLPPPPPSLSPTCQGRRAAWEVGTAVTMHWIGHSTDPTQSMKHFTHTVHRACIGHKNSLWVLYVGFFFFYPSNWELEILDAIHLYKHYIDWWQINKLMISLFAFNIDTL